MDNIQLEQQFDLSNTSRDGLRLVLNTANDEWVKYNGCHEEVKQYKKFIDGEKAKKFMLKTSVTYTMILLSVVVFGLLYLSLPDQVRDYGLDQIRALQNDSSLSPVFIIFITFCLFVLIPFIFCLPFYIRGNRQFQQTMQENMKRYELELANLEQKEQEAINELKAFLLIPDDYAYEYALTKMLQLIDNKRADNWKEITALYEEHLHRMKMEDAARKTAENSRMQAEYARQTRNATRSAAAGVWASAAGIWLRR